MICANISVACPVVSIVHNNRSSSRKQTTPAVDMISAAPLEPYYYQPAVDPCVVVHASAHTRVTRPRKCQDHETHGCCRASKAAKGSASWHLIAPKNGETPSDCMIALRSSTVQSRPRQALACWLCESNTQTYSRRLRHCKASTSFAALQWLRAQANGANWSAQLRQCNPGSRRFGEHDHSSGEQSTLGQVQAQLAAIRRLSARSDRR
jgi:hypothetical protein